MTAEFHLNLDQFVFILSSFLTSNLFYRKMDTWYCQLGTTADRHIVSRLTYNMSIDIQYVDQHTQHVCRSRYCMSINIQYVNRHYALMYLDRHIVSRLTYSMRIDIHGVYVDRHTVCRSAIVPN